MIASQSSIIPKPDLELVNMIKMNNSLLILPLDTLEYNVFTGNISILSPQEVQWELFFRPSNTKSQIT
jgi:hypothetical protein